MWETTAQPGLGNPEINKRCLFSLYDHGLCTRSNEAAFWTTRPGCMEHCSLARRAWQTLREKPAAADRRRAWCSHEERRHAQCGCACRCRHLGEGSSQVCMCAAMQGQAQLQHTLLEKLGIPTRPTVCVISLHPLLCPSLKLLHVLCWPRPGGNWAGQRGSWGCLLPGWKAALRSLCAPSSPSSAT